MNKELKISKFNPYKYTLHYLILTKRNVRMMIECNPLHFLRVQYSKPYN